MVKNYVEFGLIFFGLGVAIGGCSAALKFSKTGYTSGYHAAESKLLSDGGFFYKGKLYIFFEANEEIESNFRTSRPDVYFKLNIYQ